MAWKRKRASLAVIVVGCLAAWAGPAQAAEVTPAHTPSPASVKVIDPAGVVVSEMLHAVHMRDAAAMFARLSGPRQKDFADDARLYLKTMRVKQHALYNHDRYRVLSTDQVGDIAVHKVELTARDGTTALAIFRLQQCDDGSWRIDHIGVVDASDDRGA